MVEKTTPNRIITMQQALRVLKVAVKLLLIRRLFTIIESKSRTIRTVSIGSKPCFIEIETHRLKCKMCRHR